MANRPTVSLRALSRRTLWISLAVVLATGAAGAYAVGFTGELGRRLADPASAPVQRVAALERLETALGYNGFLNHYRDFLGSGSAAAHKRMENALAEAAEARAVFDGASEGRGDAAAGRAIDPLLAVFRRATLAYEDRDMAGSADELPSLPEVERAYGALKLEAAGVIAMARFERVAALGRALAIAQGVSIAALCLVAAALFALAWFIRVRIIEPVEAVRRSAENAADGAVFHPVWGIDRADEIGALARATDRLRRAVASAPDAGIASPAKDVRITIEGQASHFFERVMERLAQGAGRLEDELDAFVQFTGLARDRVEEACADTLQAGAAAREAALIARDGAFRAAREAGRALAQTGTGAGELGEIRGAVAAATAQTRETAGVLKTLAATLSTEIESGALTVARAGEAVERQSRQLRAMAGEAAVALVHLNESGKEALARALGSLEAIAGPEGALAQCVVRLATAVERIEQAGDTTPQSSTAANILSARARALFERVETVRSQPSLPGIADFAHQEDGDVAREASAIYAALAKLAVKRDAPADAGTPAALLEALAHDLDSLERFAAAARTLSDEDASVLTAALVEAIDRLNAVAGRLSAAADATQAAAAR